MKCVICKHGETKSGLVTVTLERDESIVVIKKVPASVCNNRTSRKNKYKHLEIVTYIAIVRNH